MLDDHRVYSDEEFALILRKAADLANTSDAAAHATDGLTLAEMKAAAAQAGLDPALIERAAYLVTVSAKATPLETVVGGPLRHAHVLRIPVALSEHQAAQLVSAVRIRAGLAGARDVGHADAMGMTWHDGNELDSLRVTAQPEDGGSVVTIDVDRRGALVLVVMFSGITMFLATLFSIFGLYPDSPALGIGGFVASIGGTLAAARAYWAASTRTIRERIAGVVDVAGRTLSRPGNEG